ncbi:DoxX family protein [Flavobacterium cellulosilyticum]|uniref:DoxX family protein n=1 Tax=Flavobacterium cellulosilyticum TaxID=2541731 RepID=A0A4R5CI83_9FLAO|nr:DoxX family protein [Flavobacterium cellulosilyticum]TDD97052.1 DoxX family protein [Flavobacterium cellulosilyticum]
MTNVKSLNKWANAHTYLSVDLVRIAVGVFLFSKGVTFITNIQYLVELLAPFDKSNGGMFGMFMVHYIASAHFLGGILIVFGLLTRWAIIAQLPILIGAVIINFLGEMHSQNLIISLSLVAICIFFLIYGSGKHSADYFFKMDE